MKKIFLFLLFAFILNADIVPGSSETTASLQESPALDTSVQDIQNWQKTSDAKIQENIKKTVQSKQNITPTYFEEVKFASMTTVKDLICPPLTSQWKDKGYVSRVDYIDPKQGQILCSVVHGENANAAPIAKQTFTNEAFVKKFEKLSITSDGYTSHIEDNALAANESFNKNLIYKSIENATLNDDKKLNYVDLLDAIAGLNDSIIDIQKTIELQNLTLLNGYYYSVNDSPAGVLKSELLQTIREASKELLNDKGLGKLNPFDSPDTINYLKNDPKKAEALANADTLFMINWFFDIGPTMSFLLRWLAITIIGWNVVYLGFKLINDEKKTKNREVLLSGLFVLFLWAFFGAATDIKIVDEKGKEISISKTRVQQGIARLYTETNAIADALVKSTITTYLKKFHQQHNVSDTATVHKTEDEIVRLKEELIMLNQIEEDVCSKQYNLTEISNQQKTNNLAAKQYLPTEEEAKKLFVNPYQTLLKEEYVTKKTTITGDPIVKINNGVLSLSACSNNLEKTQFVKSNIAKYEKRVSDFNSVSNLELKTAKIDLLNTTMWHMYDEYGYFSIAFLPILESINRVFDTFEKKENEYRELIFDSNNQLEDLSKFAAKNAFLLAFFDLSSIQSIISKIAALVPTSWIPFVGSTLQSATELAATLILVDILAELAQSLKIGVFIVLAITILMFAWIQKLTTYLIAPFSILIAFSNNHHERIGAILGNVIYVTIKPILLIFSIVLALISLSVFDSIFGFFTNDTAEIISSQPGFFSYLYSGFFMGFMQIIFYVLQFVIIYQLIIKQPQEWTEWLQFNIKDGTTHIAEMIESKLEKKM